MALKEPYTKITDPPKTVKEAIDWILRVTKKDSSHVGITYQDFCTSLTAVLGDAANITGDQVKELADKLSEFIGWNNEGMIESGKNGIAVRGYTSAYKPPDYTSSNANWPSACKDAKEANKSNGAKCCVDASRSNGCNDCDTKPVGSKYKECQPNGCCSLCPKQICARIFCLVVPLLYNVFDFLQKMIRNGNGWSGNIHQGDIGKFFMVCGFQTGQLNQHKTGEQIKDQLDLVTGKLGGLKNKIYKALESYNGDEYFMKLKGSKNEPKRSNTAPKSICDMIFWLTFLPYSTNYKDVLTKVNKLLNGSGNSQNIGDFNSKLDALISSLPMMFLFVEDAGGSATAPSGSNNGNTLFKKIADISVCQHIYKREYCTDSDKVAKILISIMPLLNCSIDMLKEKCGKDNIQSVSESIHTKPFLESLGWTDSPGPKIGGTMQCTEFKKYLEENLIGNSGKLKAVKDYLVTAWKSEANPISGPVWSSSGTHEPQTFREMLQWLQCLPASDAFNELKKSINSHQHGMAGGLESFMEQLSTMLLELPFMFLNLEGNFNTLLTDLFKHHGIDSPGGAFSYGKDSDSFLKLFSAIVAILSMVLRYLQQRCNDNGGEWKELQLNGKGSNAPDGVAAADLKSFLTLMGFSNTSPVNPGMKGSAFKTNTLDKCFGDLTLKNQNDKLHKIYQCARSYLNKPFSSVVSSQPNAPTTIRQMMLWLIGLPLTKEYSTLIDSNGKLSDPAIKQVVADTASISSVNLQENILTSTCGFAVTMISIEGNASSILDFLKDGFKDDNNSFSYGKTDDNGAASFDLLKDYSYKVHCQLRFLYYMTKESASNGGWKGCEYGNGAKKSSGNCQNCSGTVSCLKLFLEGTDQPVAAGPSSGTNSNPFLGLMTTGNSDNLKDVGMGFANKLNGPSSRTGDDIQRVLSHVCHTDKVKPLTNLMEYIVTIGHIEPTNLGDFIDLFRQFTCNSNGLWEQRKIKGKGNEKSIEERLTEELVILDGTAKSGSKYISDVKTVIVNLYPRDHTAKHPQQAYDLLSLSCDASPPNSQKCAPYIRPICQSLWSSYAPKIEDANTEENKFTTLQWLYDMSYKLLRGLQQLKGTFNKCDCCSKYSCGDSMVECPKALPMLYKEGLTFHTPSDLRSNNKKCKDFMHQLESVTNEKGPLFQLCEKIIDAFYHILLIKARGCVSAKVATLQVDLFKDRQEDKEQWKIAFESYINEAIQKSKEKLECTYLCKLFRDTGCNKHNSKSVATPSVPPSVTSEKVTAMEAVIPHYAPPHIDQYDYKTYQKLDLSQGVSQDPMSQYSFTDAINFHIDRSQCITPSPVSLRAVIDWLLRITVGKVDKEKNNNIKRLSQDLKTVLNTYAEVAGVEDHVTSLVSGLRKFVGYEDKSNEVFKNLEEEKKNIKEKIEKRIEAINAFLTAKEEFATEMGRALQKGKYNKGKNTGNSSFIQTIDELKKQLTVIHTKCNDAKCTKLQANPPLGQPSSNGPNTQGLKQLHDFFHALKGFAAKWDNIGKDNGQDILQTQKKAAVKEVVNQINNNQSNNEYFTKLYEALKQLGACADKVSTLDNSGMGNAKSSEYRDKIQQIISHLQDHVLSCLKDSSDNTGIGKSDPAFAVKACDSLITFTKYNVEKTIKGNINNLVEKHYNELAHQRDEQCKAHSWKGHKQLTQYLCTETLLKSITDTISVQIEMYKEHLDDLKALCQWLYRMGQLYHAGLHGFVKSLVKHLQHVIDVIKWVEGVEKIINTLKEISKKDDIITVNGLDGDIEDCCNSHKDLYQYSKFKTRNDFFTALNCRINNLLVSYILQDADESLGIQDDPSQKRRQSLTELRLIAIDSYTLQVWYDDKTQIKDWITFNGDIVKRSDLHAIKENLQNLTGVDYNPNDKGNIPLQHPQKRNRIHDFHAICVIQKFSYEAPITKLESSLTKLNGIQKQLSGVKGKCDNNSQQLHNDTNVKILSHAVTEFLKEPYGIYQFAKFVHTILGPNIFSAVIGALEELKGTTELNGKNTAEEIKATDFYKSVEGLLQGPERELENTTMEEYKLAKICDKLKALLDTLKKEYIFGYPVVTAGTATRTIAPSQTPVSAAALDADSILEKLSGVNASCLANHSQNSICDKCYEVFAYMFLGQVPKLYHSFRFMSWNMEKEWKNNSVAASITSYLVSMGFENGNIQNDNRNKLNETMTTALTTLVPKPSPPANTTSHEPEGLKEIHDKLEGLLKGLIREQHNEALQSMLKSGKDTRRRPTTISDMLHWLSGVPFSVMYEEMQKFSKSLCDLTQAVTDAKEVAQVANKATHHIPPEGILYRLGVSCAECLDVLQAVEDPLGKEPTKRFKEYIKAYDFYYPANPSELFYMFVDVIYYVYVHMKFVCNMTGRERENGGWKDCEFVSTDASAIEDYNKHTIVCKCPGSYVEYTCPRQLHRLLSSVSTVFTGRSLGFALPKEKLYSGQLKGAVIHNIIKHIFGENDNYPTLCRLLLAVSSCPPMSIGDIISFLYWYRRVMFPVDGAQANNNDANVYMPSLHREIELFPGRFDAKILTDALNDCFKGHTTGESQQRSHEEANKENMLSIMDCYGNADANIHVPQAVGTNVNCAPYLRPLAYEVYDTYVPQFSRVYLSWILHFGPRVYTALEEIKGKLNDKCAHCSDTKNSIVTCNDVLPELYSKGLDFYDPKVLNGQEKKQDGSYQPNGTPRKCNSLITQLGEVLKTCNPTEPSSPGAPLHRLIEAIEQFLWSIRLPFSLVQLSLWSVTVLFISYVFVVPLDHFKIKSHLFNRLKYTMHPSLLISDGQRRLSEVAYFAL